MSIPFQPTYLYIKQHSVTGKCYFGKSTKDPIKYNGSGKYWLRHLKVHCHEPVITLWHELFTDQAECTKFALEFSKKMDIVKSEQWLNLKAENGLDGGGREGSICSIETKRKLSISCGNPSIETRRKISIAHKGRTQTSESIEKRASANRGRHNSLEARQRMSIANANRQKIRCPHCDKEGDASNIKRWHFDNCKQIKPRIQLKRDPNGRFVNDNKF